MTLSLRNISIKRKLMLIIMGVCTVSTLLVSSGFVSYELFTFRHTILHNMSSAADIVANRSTAALTFDNKEDAEENLACLRAIDGVVAACVYKGDKVFAQYPAKTTAVFPKPRQGEITAFEGENLVVFREIKNRGERIGTFYLKSDLRELHQRLQLYASMIAVFVLASFLVTFILSTLLQQIISAPIFHLAETAKLVSTGKNFSLRAIKRADDELGQLVDGFNEMLTQIQQRDAALQRINDDLEKRVHERTRDLEAEVAERTRAEKALKQQVSRVILLNQITQTISEHQDIESIVRVVLRQLEDNLDLDLGLIGLVDKQTTRLSITAVRIKNPLLAAKLDLVDGAVISIESAGLGDCVNGKAVYLADTVKTPSGFAEGLARAGFRSAAAVPLMVEGKLFGVLLASRLKVEAFPEPEMEFLGMLSEHVALAAHQARLHAELEAAYQELRQTQQAVMQQERLKALGQMASGIAHDINNALSPVVGFGDLLARSEPHLSEQGKKFLHYIKTAGEDIAHIVARLREFYRRRDERESLLPLQINKLAEEVIDMTRPRWRDMPQSRGITVEMRADLDGSAPLIVGIESEIREALTNLILNAVDALPDGGGITIRTIGPRTSFKALRHDPAEVALEVSDTGVGMDESTREHCLEPFFSTKGKRGTGLGLAMVYGVMERHEGKIQIESQRGKGTTVRLLFPIRTPAQKAAIAVDSSIPPAPLQILCIDDEPLLRELVKEILERDGHHVEVMDGGESGVEAFRQASRRGAPFDVVITDLGMPYVDGRQVARTLKSESPGTPVIMLTGWGAFMKEDGDLPPQVDGVLSKPPRSRELREILSKFCKTEAVEK